MNAFAIVCILLATGVCGFLLYAGMGIYQASKRPRQPRHEHKWKQIGQSQVMDPDATDAIPVALLYTLQCEGCGDITSRTVRS